MALTLADALRQTGYAKDGQLQAPAPTQPNLSTMAADYLRQLPKKTAQNAINTNKMVQGVFPTDPFGKPNPDYYPEAMSEFANFVPNLMGATAFHGTPHKIKGLFDISKVGTGEGAQAYGHGMYFAENPAVAKEYALTVPKTVDSQAYSAENIAKRLFQGGFDIEYITKRLKLFYPQAKEEVITNALNSAKTGKVGGNVYKVDIPDEHIPMMLDYDKPIKDQPELYELVRSNIKDPDILKTFEHNAEKGITGANVYKNYIGGKTDADRSANALNIGIKGIRYKDAMSRGADEGTSNFVVFDPSKVKILEENGIPTRKELIQQQIDKIE